MGVGKNNTTETLFLIICRKRIGPECTLDNVNKITTWRASYRFVTILTFLILKI